MLRQFQDAYIDKKNYGSSVSLSDYHRQIKRKPPDHDQSGILLLSREDFHVSYPPNTKDKELHVFSSTKNFRNLAFGKENPMQNPSCHQSDEFDGAMNIKFHVEFFSTVGAFDINKRHKVDLCFTNNLTLMLLSRGSMRVSCMANKSRWLNPNMSEALTTETCEGRKLIQLFVMPLKLDVHDGAQKGGSNMDGFILVHTKIWEEVDVDCTFRVPHEFLMLQDFKHCSGRNLKFSLLINPLYVLSSQEHVEWHMKVTELAATFRSRVSSSIWHVPCFLCLQIGMRIVMGNFYDQFRGQSSWVYPLPHHRQLPLFTWLSLISKEIKKSKDVEVIFGAGPVVLNLHHHPLFDLSIPKNILFNRGPQNIQINGDIFMCSLMFYLGISVDLSEVQLVQVQNDFCFVSFDQRLVFQFFWACVFACKETFTFLWPPWVQNIVKWKDNMLYYNENNIRELFEDHTSSKKSHILVIGDSFGVLHIVGDVSEARVLHPYLNLINMESTSACLGTTKWVIRVVQPLNFTYISTAFICWSDVAWESRKLLTYGQLRLIFNSFCTTTSFMPYTEPTDAVYVALLCHSSSFGPMQQDYRAEMVLLMTPRKNLQHQQHKRWVLSTHDDTRFHDDEDEDGDKSRSTVDDEQHLHAKGYLYNVIYGVSIFNLYDGEDHVQDIDNEFHIQEMEMMKLVFAGLTMIKSHHTSSPSIREVVRANNMKDHDCKWAWGKESPTKAKTFQRKQVLHIEDKISSIANVCCK